LAAAPDDPGALAAVRRLHRGAERWAELADACAAVAHRAGDAAARAEARREEAAVAEARLGDLARAAAAWEEVLAAAPGDAEAQDALERLYDRLDRPEALAGALSRRLDAGFDLELAARLAELRRARLGDAAGALALHLELLQRDPGRVASRDALVSLAGAPGEAGRAALAAAERVLAAAGAHASRIAAREARLAAVEDPAERAPLLAEIRAILEVDLREPAMAFVAACRAFAEGGLAREGADRDLERLGRVTGNEDALCEVWEEAAADASPGEGLPLRRRAARLRTEAGGGAAAVAAWRAVLDAAPDDAEALSALEQLFAASRSAGELLEVARRRAALAAGPERIEILLHAARAAEELGDADAARDGLRAARAEGGGVAALEGLVRLLARAGRGPEWEDAIGALADAVRADPARRTTLLLERARALEDDADPRRPIEAYAELLAERPREADAVAGLERLLARADAREAAARALEDVHRAAGDARRLAALLEVRLETGDAAERAPLLAEVAALHERLGDRGRAFAAKLREVEDALRAGRDAPGARAELERLAGAAGGWEDVARVLEGALEGGGLPPDAALAIRRRLAVVAAERLGRLDLAARCLEDVASAAPSAEALGALARVHRRMGAPRELARTLERLADVAPVASRKELLLEVAKIMADQLSDREGAVTAYRKLLAVDPEDPNALRLLGGLLGAAERWDELADVLSREVAVADRQPNFVAEAAELRYRLGQIRHQRLSDPAAALACYREVLAKVPRHPAALGALEELAGGSGPAAVDAAMLLEPIYAAEGEHQKLVEVLEARAANQPDPAERAALLRRIAEVYGTSLKNAEMAFLAAGRAVAANPDAPESLALSVKYAQAAGLVEELASLLAEHADRVHDPRARVEFQRRLAGFAAAGDPARAAEAWQRVLDLEPTDRDAMLGLVDALRAGGDAEAFAQAIRRALAAEGAPEVRAGLLAELAAVQEDRLGDLAGAIISLKRLLDLVPGDRDALARLDELSVKTERWVDLADVLPREIAAAHAAGDAAALLALRQRLAELKETRLLDREGALALYEEVLQARPDHPEAVARLEAMLQKDPANARAATLLEASYAKGGDAAKQAAVLEVRAGERPDPLERKALYLELAALREQKLGDPQLAFLALCKAFREDPADAALRARLEALAETSDHHEELAAIYEDELDRLAPQDTARVALRLGALYEERLGEPQRAVEFLRRAVALDPEVAQAALTALERIHGRLEAWPELADALGQRALVVAGPERVQLLFRLGQLCEERLAEPDRAAQAYEDAVQSDPRHVPSLRALEVLYEGAGRQEDLFRNLAAQRVAPGDAAEKERVLAKMAVLATELGRLEEAVALWKELLAAKPRHDGALVALEDLYEQLERWQDLAQHLRLRVSATVDRREIARLNDKLGLVLGAKLGDLGQAVQSYRAVLDSDPRNRRALEALREIYATQGDHEALAGVYRRLVPLQEDARGVKRVRIELAEVLLRAGSKREAIEQARLAFDIEPHAAEELVRIEEVFRGAGAGADGVRAAEARAALLAEQGPAEAVPAWLAVADLWKGEKRPEQAAAAFEKVLELDPPNRTAYEGLRGIYAAANNWRAFARVCDLFAPNVVDPSEKIQLLTEVATVHEKRLGQKEMAFLSWCRALAEAPADGDALAAAERLAAETEAFDELAAVLEQVSEEARGTVRARLLLRLGKAKDERLDDIEGAESAFRKALEADPASPEALEALTQLFKRRGRVRDLVITLEQKLEAAAGLDEKKATLLEVARIYDGELHDVDEAVGALRRVLELDGADPAALDALSAVLRREARWPDLAQILSRARDLAPDDTQRIAFQLQIAALYEKEIGDDEASVEAYRTVLGLDDRNADALAGLERLYTKLDRFAELNRVYERQIALAEDARERVRILAKSAGIHEEKLNDPRAAIEKNEAILRVDGGNLPSIKALERLYRDEALWDRLISVLQHHLTLVSERREQVALEVAIGEVFYEEMSRVDRAEAIFNHALQLDPESREAVSALGRLYERSGNWNLALDMLKREARIAGGAKDAVDLHVRMGAIHEDMLMDVRSAKEAYARALQLEPGCLPAIRAVKGIAERERDRDRFLEMLVEEARYAQDGAEKTRLYTEAARVYHEERDDKESAARYYEEALKRTPGHPDAAR
ncbi:MAG TPA: hypothetical protein VM753_18995, partial [Anaeromyxobacter sp.]|nr:hypothetical protein [Anaeromyxobacter sp.]